MAIRAKKGKASTATVEETLGHVFARRELLESALTHRSLLYETSASSRGDLAADNEQLEFVGDAVVGLLVAEGLYRRFRGSAEGELTRMRASLVSRRHLAEVGAKLRLGEWLKMGPGLEHDGGRRKPPLLANALEAVIAAIYLDAGLEAARGFVEREILEPAMPRLTRAVEESGTFSGAVGDYKSALQERFQAEGAEPPQYFLAAESGPGHARRFRVEVQVPDGAGGTRTLGTSEGASKKEAQQEAARLALAALDAESALDEALR